jgi:hypothetical protein
MTTDVNAAFAAERAGQLEAARAATASWDGRIASGKLVPIGNGQFRVNDPGSWDDGEVFTQRNGIAVPQSGLDMVDGKAQLYTAVPAWHNLGNVIPGGTSDVAEVLRLGGIDFEVGVTEEAYGLARGRRIVVPGKHVTYRDDTMAGLGVVGSIYTPVQPRQSFKFLQELTGKGDAIWETAGPLRGGRKIFITLRLPETVVIDAGGINDEIQMFLAVLDSFDGTRPFTAIMTPWRILCHAEGTMIDDNGWRGPVEGHHSATMPRMCAGKAVVVSGLPFLEKVTPEHRYWARGNVTDSHDKRTGSTAAGWVKARDLQAGHHEIGLPIDMTEALAPEIQIMSHRRGLGNSVQWHAAPGRDPRLDDPEWWWLLGYWWGNGNLARGRGGRIAGLTVSIAETDSPSIDRALSLFRAEGSQCTPQEQPGCVQITFTDATLGNFLSTWYAGKSQKAPPAWVERLPLECQRQLVRGYWDADGDHRTRGAIISSVGLDGLLAMRRILARLGIPSSIRKDRAVAGTMQIQGRHVQVQQSWSIRFWRDIEQLGLTHRFQGRHSWPYIEGGHLWSRVRSVSDTPPEKFWPITTRTHDYTTAFGRSHNCSNTERFGLRDAATKWTVRHTTNAPERVQEARKTLGLSLKYAEAFKAEEEKLAQTEIEIREFEALMADLWPEPDEPTLRQRNRIARRKDGLRETFATETRRAGRTAYAAERAVTGWLDNAAPRSVTGDRLAAARATAVLEDADGALKSRAHQRLLQLQVNR